MTSIPQTDGLDRSHLPHACGVYLMRDGAGTILYIGKAKDLSARVAQYFDASRHPLKNATLMPLVRRIDYVPCASEREALLLEQRLIRARQPFFNVLWKDDKSYPYVKITLGEDFPRIVLTRRKAPDGGAYFGPYPKVAPVKALLRDLWRRKYFPLRPCRWSFGVDQPLSERKINACLYYHTRECPAPCAGRISPGDYRRIAERAVLFFRGDYRRLKKDYELEMRRAAARLDFEGAARCRDNLQGMEQLSERVRMTRVNPGEIEKPLASSRAVEELQRALGLDRPPFHIECFDVSHFQGLAHVAAMSCFRGAEPFKDHYRRFKIRTVSGIDDFAALFEVVQRRYRRLSAEGELPDLVLIDGGLGQLHAASRALRQAGVRIPIASLAKRLEAVYTPETSEPLILPRSSEALKLLQRLRDEAHRFGVTYHRLLRRKGLLRGRDASS